MVGNKTSTTQLIDRSYVPSAKEYGGGDCCFLLLLLLLASTSSITSCGNRTGGFLVGVLLCNIR